MTQEQAATTPTGEYHYGTGRRKTAVARVRIYPGAGNIAVNGKPFLTLFTRVTHQNRVRLPLEVASAAGTFDVSAHVAGGGVSAWADAIAHGISRALIVFNEGLRPPLRKAGLLTRDPRIKERKKPGLKRARKAPQYTKR
jgi:small subunit ribosomal protein S9